MNCPHCQQLAPIDAAFCPSCGASVAATGATQRLNPAMSHLCAKCGNSMDRGFIPDEFRDRNEVTVWVRGEPQRDNRAGAVLLGGADMWEVVTFRCMGCGYLESYAVDKLELRS
jgi:Double zinc ribbon